ncbi:MAG TPA: metal-dependent transcriptional regulator [Kiritimatiellia bacterium]|nr:metal-dependent transcriptional regulator [Kiritimatiellia bacterium]
MASSTIENYVKQIYLIQQELGQPQAPMGRLSTALGITPGTATTMVKALADSGLAVYEPRVGVSLSPGGEKLALHVLRRHRLVELFLVQVLELDWSEVHEEAERLEHAISDKVMERIDAYLNFPTHDPHGDPIPDAEGEIATTEDLALPDVGEGPTLVVVRVLDQSPDFLQFMNRNKLQPGCEIEVVHSDRVSDSMTLKVGGGHVVTMGMSVARQIRVARRPLR